MVVKTLLMPLFGTHFEGSYLDSPERPKLEAWGQPLAAAAQGEFGKQTKEWRTRDDER